MPIFCALFPLLCCGRKLEEYKNTQPLIGMPEPLPETGVLANHCSGKFERNEWKKEWKKERMKEWHTLGLFNIRFVKYKIVIRFRLVLHILNLTGQGHFTNTFSQKLTTKTMEGLNYVLPFSISWTWSLNIRTMLGKPSNKKMSGKKWKESKKGGISTESQKVLNSKCGLFEMRGLV